MALKSKVNTAIMRRQWGAGFAIISVFIYAIVMDPVFARAEGEKPQLPLLTSESQIRAAITELRQPLDGRKIQLIADSINEQSNFELIESLRTMLNERLEQLRPDNGAIIIKDDNGAITEATVLRLRQEIERLNLGPDAPAEEFRRRDALVRQIAVISDPKIRYNLQDLLAAKERLSEGSSKAE